MKKWISTLLVVSLVVGMAAVLHACGKPKTPETTTTEGTTFDLFGNENEEETYTESMWEEYLDSLDETDESYSYTERTTDEHYQEEYDALTLPHAVTTQPVAGTTLAQTTTNPAVRETTTQFQFTYSAQTTRANVGGKTTKPADTTKAAATTKAATTKPAEKETTLVSDVLGDTGTSNISLKDAAVLPMPQITNLDRYVIKRLNSGRYTAKMDIRMEGMTMPITYYTDGNNSATEMIMSDLLAKQMDIPMIKIGRIRLVTKGLNTSSPKAYVTWPGSYYEIDGGDMEGFAEALQEARGAQDIGKLLQIDNLGYLGKETGVGYVRESYKIPGEDIAYSFYFTDVDAEGYEGLVRWEVINLQTGAVEQTMDIRLMDTVPADAFDVKGQKKSLEDMEKLFGG